MNESDIFDAIGTGMILRVPHTPDPPALIENMRLRYPHPNKPPRESITISRDEAHSAIQSGRLYKLSAEGNPPPAERKRSDGGYRMGWKEMGLDGSSADLYVSLQ